MARSSRPEFIMEITEEGIVDGGNGAHLPSRGRKRKSKETDTRAARNDKEKSKRIAREGPGSVGNIDAGANECTSQERREGGEGSSEKMTAMQVINTLRGCFSPSFPSDSKAAESLRAVREMLASLAESPSRDPGAASVLALMKQVDAAEGRILDVAKEKEERDARLREEIFPRICAFVHETVVRGAADMKNLQNYAKEVEELQARYVQAKRECDRLRKSKEGERGAIERLSQSVSRLQEQLEDTRKATRKKPKSMPRNWS